MNHSLELQQIIEKSSRIALFGHDNPDGDAIGSLLGFGRLLENMQKKVSYFAYPQVSRVFDFVPGIHKIKHKFDYSSSYDLLVFLDFSYYSRTIFSSGRYDYFDGKPLLVIDHHVGPTPAHALVLKDELVDSNCGWIFEITKTLRGNYYDDQIASYLYMGIVTDTGNFSYDKQGSRALRNAADLVDLGAQKLSITTALFSSIKLEQFEFVSQMIPKLEIIDSFAFLIYSDHDYKRLGLDKEEAGDLLIYLITKIRNLSFFVFCRYDDQSLKLSLRSKDPQLNAEALARSRGGGGHFYAAGAKIELLTNEDPSLKFNELTADIVKKLTTASSGSDESDKPQ